MRFFFFFCRIYISRSSVFALLTFKPIILVILNYLPISAYSGLLKFDMKMFVTIARLDIGQLFTQSTRRGHPCTWTHF